MPYPQTRNTRIVDTMMSVRASNIIRAKHETVGELLDAIKITDEKLAELVVEFGGGKDYDVWGKMRRRLTENLQRCGWATASDIISVIANMALVEDLRSGASKVSVRSGDQALRDHFAGLAMAGMCASADYEARTYEQAAENAYRQADAMIAERSK